MVDTNPRKNQNGRTCGRYLSKIVAWNVPNRKKKVAPGANEVTNAQELRTKNMHPLEDMRSVGFPWLVLESRKFVPTEAGWRFLQESDSLFWNSTKTGEEPYFNDASYRKVTRSFGILLKQAKSLISKCTNSIFLKIEIAVDLYVKFNWESSATIARAKKTFLLRGDQKVFPI